MVIIEHIVEIYLYILDIHVHIAIVILYILLNMLNLVIKARPCSISEACPCIIQILRDFV